ncbi:MAG: YggT family protein, partial [Deltaproteobacteria bacterium]|nr:YggT family protein [Deltaproteobacteria bacterium]
MPLLGNLLIALGKVISLIVGVYTFIVAGAVIISWVRPDPYNPIVQFLNRTTEPVFSWVRRFIPRFLYQTGIDFTPLLVIVLLVFLETLIAG